MPLKTFRKGSGLAFTMRDVFSRFWRTEDLNNSLKHGNCHIINAGTEMFTGADLALVWCKLAHSSLS